ncbi:MAG: VOC family protein [Oscillospiraceae bacterium]
MKIEHIAIYTTDLERECAFFEKYFGAARGEKYHNPQTGLQTYFLTFDGGARLEVMTRAECVNQPRERFAAEFAHIAISVGSKEKVVQLAELLEKDGFQIASPPRTTGDGYFESVVLDFDGNFVEITV